MFLAGPLWAEEAIYRFEWTGQGGYSMRGALAFEPGEWLVRERDVTCFVIEGFHEGQSLGHWDLSMKTEWSNWRLHFNAQTGSFFVEGEGAVMPQAWNMAGNGSGCGEGGFGFNLGNVAQDICVDDAVVLASQKDPFAPFPALRDQSYVFPRGACGASMLLGALSLGPDGRSTPLQATEELSGVLQR